MSVTVVNEKQPNPNETGESVMKSIKKNKSRGATMAEYCVLLALITVAAVTAFRTFGTQIQSKVGEAGTAIQ